MWLVNEVVMLLVDSRLSPDAIVCITKWLVRFEPSFSEICTCIVSTVKISRSVCCWCRR